MAKAAKKKKKKKTRAKKSSRKRPAKPRRPRRPLTRDQLEEVKAMARAHCLDTTIARVMKIPEATFRTNYKDLTAQLRVEAKAILRKRQFHLALKGNTALLIFLGKQWLGQSDRHVVTPGDKPLKAYLHLGPKDVGSGKT